MKIAYLTPGYPPDLGGVERHVSELARRLAADGHLVEVLAQQSDPRLCGREMIDGVAVRRFAARMSRGRLAIAPGLLAALRGARFDVFHAHSYHAFPALAGALAGARPLVFTPQYLGRGDTPMLRMLHRAYWPLGRLIFERSSVVLCVSQAEATLVRRHFRGVSTPIAVVPLGVDVAGLRAAEPYCVAGTPILTAARLEAYKNVQLTIRALVHLGREFSLYVAGDGPYRRRLEDLAAGLGLEERVTFLGRLDPADLHRFYRTAKVYVTVSQRESFGITLLEALAAGSGVVASDIPPHREVVRNTREELVSFIPLASEPDVLAEAIQGVVAGHADGRAAANPPSWDAITEQHLKIYHSVVTKRDGR